MNYKNSYILTIITTNILKFSKIPREVAQLFCEHTNVRAIVDTLSTRHLIDSTATVN